MLPSEISVFGGKTDDGVDEKWGVGYVYIASSYDSADKNPSDHAHRWCGRHWYTDRNGYTTISEMRLKNLTFPTIVLSIVLGIVVSTTGKGGLGQKTVRQIGPGPLRFTEFENSIPLLKKRLSVHIPWGEITVTGGGKPEELSVKAIVQLNPNEKNETQIPYEKFLVMDSDADGVDIKVNTSHWLPFLGHRRNGSRPINIFMKIPDDMEVTLHHSNGRIQLSRLSGEFFVFSDEGHVELSEYQGNLSIETKSGGIRVDEAVIGEKLTLKSQAGTVYFSGVPGTNTFVTTDSGSITLAIPRNGSYEITVDEGLGSLESQLPIVNGRLGQGASKGTLHIMTVSGSIQLEGMQK